MQYAVISTGGKQYLAFPGKELVIEKLPLEEGSSIEFDQVLLSVDGDKVEIGQPTVDGLTVSATVVKQGLGDKIRVFKYKSKSRYRRTIGHRQHETIIRIDAIGDIKAESSVKSVTKSEPKSKPTSADSTKKISSASKSSKKD